LPSVFKVLQPGCSKLELVVWTISCHGSTWYDFWRWVPCTESSR
jgi:hypothetical protein